MQNISGPCIFASHLSLINFVSSNINMKKNVFVLFLHVILIISWCRLSYLCAEPPPQAQYPAKFSGHKSCES